jgi:ubiquinone/menaquinone biosynthesis C-methylase UbiE
MGLYRRFVFPFLCDLTLCSRHVGRYRQELLATAGGDVLEIGFGTGLNLGHYPPSVRRLATADPNPGAHLRAQRRAERAGITLDHHMIGSERLPFPDGTFDCVVCTFTLCSVTDPERAVAEAYRVLRPKGRFLFLEHGLSPDAGVRRWQRRLNGIQRVVGDGCHLDRDIKRLVTGSFKETVKMDEFYLEKTPRTHGYVYRGIATR